jgi:hypothetical protein
MRFGWVLVAAVLALGVAGTVLALHSREGNAQFVSEQQSLAPVGASQLESLILTTSDPRPGYGGSRARARRARCASSGHSVLGNPWTCVVRYSRTPQVRYRVSVYANRSIFGSGHALGLPSGTPLIVRGCCVAAGP